MADLEEVRQAIRCLHDNGAKDLILLHCVSNYPADARNANLRAMATMANAFALPIGYSDHTLGIEVSLAAVTLGACVIEKHFTLDHNRSGPDHKSSLMPQQFADLVAGIRIVESALGHGRKEPAADEALIASVARRSLFSAIDIPAQTVIEDSMIIARRPGTGLPPTEINQVIGRRAKDSIPAGTAINLELLT